MPTKTIVVGPAQEWAAGQFMTFRLAPVTLASGRVLSDFASFVLTIREDPLWPRVREAAAQKSAADPVADGWPVRVAATQLYADVVAGVPTFNFTTPAGAGVDRYAFDVWGVLAADPSDRIQLYPSTWLTALGSVYSG